MSLVQVEADLLSQTCYSAVCEVNTRLTNSTQAAASAGESLTVGKMDTVLAIRFVLKLSQHFSMIIIH